MNRLGPTSRRILATAVALLTLWTAACGEDAQESADLPTKGDGKVEGTLTMWYSPSESTLGPWWDRLAKDFHAKYPDAKVEITRFSTEEYITKVQAAFAAGDEPDIFEASGPGEELQKFVRVGKIAPLNDLAELSHYQDAAVQQYATGPEGEIYAVPRSKYFLSMWFNKDLFEERGWTPPKSWDDLLGFCREASADGIIPIALGVGGQDQWTAGHLYDTILYQYGGADLALDATYGDEGSGWTDPEFLEAGDRYAEMVEAKCFPEGVAGLNYAQMSSLFLRGDAATIFTGTWFGAQVAAGGQKFAVDVFPFPDGPGAKFSTGSLEGIVGGVAGLAASRKAVDRSPALVAAFLDFLGESVDDYANDNGVVSVAADPKPTGGRLQSALTKLGDAAGEVGPVTDVVVPPSIVDDYMPNLQSLTSGDLSPEEFTKAMEEAVAAERPNLPERAGSE